MAMCETIKCDKCRVDKPTAEVRCHGRVPGGGRDRFYCLGCKDAPEPGTMTPWVPVRGRCTGCMGTGSTPPLPPGESARDTTDLGICPRCDGSGESIPSS